MLIVVVVVEVVEGDGGTCAVGCRKPGLLGCCLKIGS